MKPLPESEIALRSLLAQVKEAGMTQAQAVAWIVSHLVEQSQDERAGHVKEKPAPRPHDPATGPAPQEWRAPTNGRCRFDGRFVPNANWKPAEKPVETPREYAVPDVASLITHTRNTGSHVGVQESTPVRMVSVVHEQSGTSRLVPWTQALQDELDSKKEQ